MWVHEPRDPNARAPTLVEPTASAWKRTSTRLERAPSGSKSEVAVEVPRQREVVRRIPVQNDPPQTFRAVVAELVPSTADPRLDDRRDHRDATDVMRPWPPRCDLRAEDLERTVDRYSHHDRRSDGGLTGEIGRIRVGRSVLHDREPTSGPEIRSSAARQSCAARSTPSAGKARGAGQDVGEGLAEPAHRRAVRVVVGVDLADRERRPSSARQRAPEARPRAARTEALGTGASPRRSGSRGSRGRPRRRGRAGARSGAPSRRRPRARRLPGQA